MLVVYTDAQKMAFSNSSFLKSVLEKLRSVDRTQVTQFPDDIEGVFDVMVSLNRNSKPEKLAALLVINCYTTK